MKSAHINVEGAEIPVAYQCPDCNNDVRVAPMGDGASILKVVHDDTCPWLGRHR